MKVHYDLQQLPIFNKAVITIGTFDGVHTGHRAIMQQLKDEASKINGETVILTFHPHPRMVVAGQLQPLHLINTLSEKIELLQQQGIDHLVVVPFTQAFSEQTAEGYISEFLVKKFHPNTIIIGYDHRFGQGRKGNYQLLESLKDQYHFNLKEIPAQLLQHSAISSTKIRQAIAHGQILIANECLGYDYFFEGTVVKGNQLGRTIGYPTANLQINNTDKILPANGVYAVKCKVVGSWQMTDGSKKISDNSQPPTYNHQQFSGMMNIGTRPTVNGSKLTIEVNLFDFDTDIYSKTLRVYVQAHLRSEEKFNGLDALKTQLAIDKENAMEILKD